MDERQTVVSLLFSFIIGLVFGLFNVQGKEIFADTYINI